MFVNSHIEVVHQLARLIGLHSESRPGILPRACASSKPIPWLLDCPDFTLSASMGIRLRPDQLQNQLSSPEASWRMPGRGP